jgi:hypothetical protein
MRSRLTWFFSILMILLIVQIGTRAKERVVAPPVLSHADAAVILAKYSGFFDRYISQDANLNSCVSFLNKTGIYFGLKEVLDGSVFTEHDFARAAGQMALVFGGDAEYESGKVKLPKSIASWEEFCTMNDINYVQGHQGMCEKFGVLAQKRME